VNGQQQTVSIGDDMALAPIDWFTAAKAARAAGLVVGALWLSMIAAVGLGLRPSLRGASCSTPCFIRRIVKIAMVVFS
jgi:hypothetical protein